MDKSLLDETLVRTAPGTELREGLERILRGRTGALIVLGDGRPVESISTGGFHIGADFSAARLRELAKMDGAIVLNREGSRILYAAAHLSPASTIEAIESGTRHRTAERTSVATGHPVVTVSASMNIIALFIDGQRHVLERTEIILDRANQALNTLERYCERLETIMNHLSSQEIEAQATVRELATAVQRQEMVRRVIREISTYVLELGTEGRLVSMQLEELASGTEGNTELLLKDYAALRVIADEEEADLAHDFLTDDSLGADEVLREQQRALSELSSQELVDLGQVSAILGVHTKTSSLDQVVEPRGHRILGQIRNIPPAISERIVEHFGSLQPLLAASTEELMEIDGVGEQRAKTVREALSRMAESNFYDRY